MIFWSAVHTVQQYGQHGSWLVCRRTEAAAALYCLFPSCKSSTRGLQQVSLPFASSSVAFHFLYPREPRWLAEWAQRGKEGSQDLSANDFVIVHCRLRPDGRCDVGDCLEKLYSMGFKSLMVEVNAGAFCFLWLLRQSDGLLDFQRRVCVKGFALSRNIFRETFFVAC